MVSAINGISHDRNKTSSVDSLRTLEEMSNSVLFHLGFREERLSAILAFEGAFSRMKFEVISQGISVNKSLNANSSSLSNRMVD